MEDVLLRTFTEQRQVLNVELPQHDVEVRDVGRIEHDEQVLFVLACVVGTQAQYPGPFVIIPDTTRVCRPIAWAFASIVAALHRPTVRAQSSAIDLLSFMNVVGLGSQAALHLEAAIDQLVPECREVAANTLASLRR